MANNRINKYLGAMALGTVLVAVPACTDTWDDHYNKGLSDPQATTTLWEQISQDPNLSRFAKIAESAKYWKDEKHAVQNYTYKDVLNSGQITTAWIPDNNAIDDATLSEWLDKCETDGYAVQQQFFGNHIALWRHDLSGGGVDTVKMINGKNLIFDKDERTLQGIKVKNANLAAINGTIHILEGQTPFRYNLYERMKYSKDDNFSMIRDYVISKDTLYFYEAASIEGIPDENGKPTYVDSVYRYSNRLLERSSYLPTNNPESWQMAEEGFGARINEEDSMFIMLQPSNVAWETTYNKLKPYYNYAVAYDDKVKGNQGNTTYITGLDADSLSKMSINMDIVSPLVFNVNKQPKAPGNDKLWKLDDFVASKGAECEYFLNTFGDTIRSLADWDKTQLFNVEPVKVSNGYAYEISSWEFPLQFYKPDVEIEIESTGNFYKTDDAQKYKVGSTTGRYAFNNELFDSISSRYGIVSNNNFFFVTGSGPADKPKVEIKLKGNSPTAYVPNAEVMSGKYDIQLVLVPRWYLDISKAGEIPDEFYKKDTVYAEPDEYYMEGDPLAIDTIYRTINHEYIATQAAISKYTLKATLYYNNGATSGKDGNAKAVSFTTDGTKVDTLTIQSDFTFPYSYKNMRFSYPTLVIEGANTATNAKKGFVYDFIIDKVILKSKADN